MNLLRLPHGQSGAGLRVIDYKGITIVRKSAATIGGNARLHLQMEKQRIFSTCGTDVKVPEILDCGYDKDGLFYFDMRFILGLDGHRFLEVSDPRSLRNFAEKLSYHLALIRELPLIGVSTKHKSLYESCICKLSEIHRHDSGLSDELAGKMLRALEVVRDHDSTEEGFCHGDFTLENILVDGNGELYFVDFLDSNFEHPIQDFFKLGQDIHGGWFRIKGRRISSAFIAYLEDLLTRNGLITIPGYLDIRSVMIALNFCRILPYLQDPSLKESIIKKIEKFTFNSK